MNKFYSDVAIVIPCFEPPQTLVAYVAAFIARGFSHIYIVNDGSDAQCDFTFAQLETMEVCTVLVHRHNKGKGAALKTAYHAIATAFETCRVVITVDCDGQHAVHDVCRIAEALPQHPDGLLLGARDFSKAGVPIKSYAGNRCASFLFFLLYGRWVQDTQTGLRAFSAKFLPKMCEIQGARFEYEMAVLTTFANEKIPIKHISIDTIYIQGNESTHFNPIADSLRIFRVLFKRIGRFLLSSGTACLVDISLCWLLLYLLAPTIQADLLRIGISVGVARLCSLVVNYSLNKCFVFHVSKVTKMTFARYLALAIGNVLAATVLIYLGHTVFYMGERIAKLCADTILLCINYQVQRLWVFSAANLGGNREKTNDSTESSAADE